MKLPQPLVPALFLRRDNRFRVTVEMDGRPVAAHLPNSGRLGEILVPGRTLWLTPGTTPGRKTAYDVVLATVGDTLVSVDARLPGHLLAEALTAGGLAAFIAYRSFQREVRLGESRLDFLLTDEPSGSRCWVEVKSVTLVINGVGRFPDAPTTRGQRHVRELVKAVEAGDRAAVVFVIQREDAVAFAPHDDADSLFGTELRRAAQAGVQILAYRCRVTMQEIHLTEAVPVIIKSLPAGEGGGNVGGVKCGRCGEFVTGQAAGSEIRQERENLPTVSFQLRASYGNTQAGGYPNQRSPVSQRNRASLTSAIFLPSAVLIPPSTPCAPRGFS